jgi:hypothetical protein
MSAVLLFVAGIITGLILTAIGIIAALHWPEPRDSVRPQFFAVAGDKPMLHPGSAVHGAVPSDWSGPVWNPRSRLIEVPTRVVRRELY